MLTLGRAGEGVAEKLNAARAAQPFVARRGLPPPCGEGRRGGLKDPERGEKGVLRRPARGAAVRSSTGSPSPLRGGGGGLTEPGRGAEGVGAPRDGGAPGGD